MKLFALLVLFLCFSSSKIVNGKAVNEKSEKIENSSNSEKPRKVQKRLDGGEIESVVIQSGGGSFEGHHHHSDKGYSIGSGLRSIAQGSAHQAHSAVVNQAAAAIQASFVAKNTLAHAAVQAAATAHAALAGKEVLLQELEHQNVDAHHRLEAEIAQLGLSKQVATLAKSVAQQAASHVAILSSALNSAQGVSEQSEQAAHAAEQELASQSAMVGKAKAKLHEIQEHLHNARIDYEATKVAAEKAAAAAHEAQSNAAAAGVHAQNELTETAGKKVVEGSENQIIYSEGHDIPYKRNA